MSNYVADRSLTLDGVSIPVNEIRTVRVKKKAWRWIFYALQVILSLRLFIFLGTWSDTSPGDPRTLLVGQIVGTLFLLVVCRIITEKIKVRLMIETASKTFALGMKEEDAKEAHSQIGEALKPVVHRNSPTT